jgi:hypothetical protein
MIAAAVFTQSMPKIKKKATRKPPSVKRKKTKKKGA